MHKPGTLPARLGSGDSKDISSGLRFFRHKRADGATSHQRRKNFLLRAKPGAPTPVSV